MLRNSRLIQKFEELLGEPHAEGDREQFFETILRLVADNLEVSRVSLWFLESAGQELRCEKLLIAGKNIFESDHRINAREHASYFEFFEQNKALLAHEARTHPTTQSFSSCYLIPLDIHSMLDLPLKLNGKVIGVVCLEQTGAPRTWNDSDVFFGLMATEMISKRLWIEKAEHEKQRSFHLLRLATVGELTATILHEVRNPLLVVSGQVDLLKRQFGESEKAIKSFDRILSQVEKITEIIKKVNSNCRVSSGEAEFFSLNLCIDSIVGLQKPLARDLSCELSFQGDFNWQLLANELEFSQVLLNLIKNALDEMEKRPEEGRWVRVEVQKSPTELQIFVTDSGSGIPTAVASQIFEKFFTTKDKNRGTGLGLAICKDIIENYGGKIAYDPMCSNTRFVIRFPNEKVRPAPAFLK